MKYLDVAVALIIHRGLCFAQRRAPGAASCPGRWEFPGGKLEPGESPWAALSRELLEEVRWTPPHAAALPALRHVHPGLAVVLHPFLCWEAGPERPMLETSLAWGWFSPGELARLPMPEANGGLLALLPAHLSEGRYMMGGPIQAGP